jgi:hypothetical protein
MAMTRDFAAGNYRYIPSVFQYSSGAAADPGFEIERVRFDTWVSLAEGFARVADYIRSSGRPLTSLCGCELRSPTVMDDQGFLRFNQHYVKTLAEWGLFDGTNNPVARTNVCLEIDPPTEPSFYAFAFTRPSKGPKQTFVIAGGAESRSSEGTAAERVVRYLETGEDAIREKAQTTVAAMEGRLAAFGADWSDTTAAQIYTVHDFHPIVATELVRRGAARSGLTWHFARPPVLHVEFEMDCRRVAQEVLI